MDFRFDDEGPPADPGPGGASFVLWVLAGLGLVLAYVAALVLLLPKP